MARFCFEHTSGGDSLLPQSNRGFFDSWSVDADSEEEAMRLMYEMRACEHPDWVDRAVDDLVAVEDK